MFGDNSIRILIKKGNDFMGLKIIGETKVGGAKRLIVELDEGYKALISVDRYKKGKVPRPVSATNPYSVEKDQ